MRVIHKIKIHALIYYIVMLQFLVHMLTITVLFCNTNIAVQKALILMNN